MCVMRTNVGTYVGMKRTHVYIVRLLLFNYVDVFMCVHTYISVRRFSYKYICIEVNMCTYVFMYCRM